MGEDGGVRGGADGGMGGDGCGWATWNTKMAITQVLGYPPGSIFNQNDPTMSLDVPACPKGVNFN